MDGTLDGREQRRGGRGERRSTSRCACWPRAADAVAPARPMRIDVDLAGRTVLDRRRQRDQPAHPRRADRALGDGARARPARRPRRSSGSRTASASTSPCSTCHARARRPRARRCASRPRTARIERRPPLMPVVILSSIGMRERDDAAVAAWLAKPVKPSALHDTLADVLLGSATERDRPPWRRRSTARSGERHPLRILLAEDNAVNQKLALAAARARWATGPTSPATGCEAHRGARARRLRRRPDGRPDARARRPRGDAPHPRRVARAAAAHRGHDGQRHGRRPRGVPRGRHERLRRASRSGRPSSRRRSSERRPSRTDATPNERRSARARPERRPRRAARSRSAGTTSASSRELVDAYLAEAPAHLDAIEAAVAAGDAAALVRPAHTLKSSSATLGAMRARRDGRDARDGGPVEGRVDEPTRERCRGRRARLGRRPSTRCARWVVGAGPMTRRRVALVVDDSRVNRHAPRAPARDARASRSREASNGRAALELLRDACRRDRRRAARRHDARDGRLRDARRDQGRRGAAPPAGDHDLGRRRARQRGALHRAGRGRLPAQAVQPGHPGGARPRLAGRQAAARPRGRVRRSAGASSSTRSSARRPS